MLRATKPKLSLNVPALRGSGTGSGPASAIPHPQKSPFPFPLAVSPSPLSTPTIRNTQINQRKFGSLQVPTAGIKLQPRARAQPKKVSFADEAAVACLSPMPADYHGTYVQMSKEERRWVRRD